VATLKAIASEAQGEYFRATSTSELNKIYQLIDNMESFESDAPAFVIPIDLRNLFLIALLMLVVVVEIRCQWTA